MENNVPVMKNDSDFNIVTGLFRLRLDSPLKQRPFGPLNGILFTLNSKPNFCFLSFFTSRKVSFVFIFVPSFHFSFRGHVNVSKLCLCRLFFPFLSLFFLLLLFSFTNQKDFFFVVFLPFLSVLVHFYQYCFTFSLKGKELFFSFFNTNRKHCFCSYGFFNYYFLFPNYALSPLSTLPAYT